jgi:hypothetical protein
MHVNPKYQSADDGTTRREASSVSPSRPSFGVFHLDLGAVEDLHEF